ncbi:MAG: low temperature requirement protein A [Dermatophilaceae bacterium]
MGSAIAYTVVRLGQLALFWFASGQDAGTRRSVVDLAMSTALGVGPLFTAAFAAGWAQVGLWLLPLALDYGGPIVTSSPRLAALCGGLPADHAVGSGSVDPAVLLRHAGDLARQLPGRGQRPL